MKNTNHGSLALADQMMLAGSEAFLNDNAAPTLRTMTALELFRQKKNETPYSNDGVSETLNSTDELLEFLQAREDNAKWLTGIATSSLRLMVDSRPGNDSTGLLLYSEAGDITPTTLRECGRSTMLDRARVGGTALSHVSNQVLCDIVNECYMVAPTSSTAKIRIADERISSVMSEHYVPLSMPELFSLAIEEIDTRFPRNVFAGADWSHSLTSGYWTLGNESKLIDAYIQALHRHNVKIDVDAIEPALRLTSSDVGLSGANLRPILMIGKDAVMLPIGGITRLEHKSGATMDNFVENLGGVFGQYRVALTELAALLEIGIVYPEGCFAAVAKRLNIAKKYAEPARESFARAYISGGSCTAHDVYVGLGEVLYQLQLNNITGEHALKVEEAIAGALALNWREYDKPLKED